MIINTYTFTRYGNLRIELKPRFGFNSYTYNLATRKGKISYYLGFVIYAVIFIPLFFNLLSMEFTNPKITISSESISVDYHLM